MDGPATTSTPVSTRDAYVPAPRWHTAILVALMVTVAVTGTLLGARAAPTTALPSGTGRVAGVYLPLTLVQWSLALYVVRVGRPRSALRALLGTPWRTVWRACGDLALE